MFWTKRSSDDETTESSMPSVHVVARDDHWIVRSAHSQRAIAAFNTQEQAIERARRIAATAGTDVVVHAADGRVRDTIPELAAATGPNYHVTRREAEWVVATDGAERAGRSFDSKLEAVDAARELARLHRGILLIHADDGTIEQVYRY